MPRSSRSCSAASTSPSRRATSSVLRSREVITTGSEVDLFRLPIPMSSDLRRRADDHRRHRDGPRSGVRHHHRHLPLHGQGEGAHRHRHRHAEQHAPLRAAAYEQGRPCGNLDLHRQPSDGDHGRRYRAPIGVDEMGIAGGMRGMPVELGHCETIDLPFLADSEIVLEAEILPTGWTQPEGRFGEFTALMGGRTGTPTCASRPSCSAATRSTTPAHAVGEHLARRADALPGDPPRAAHGWRAGPRTSTSRWVGARSWHAVISIKTGRRRQERAAGRTVGDGPEARRRGRRRHRRRSTASRLNGPSPARAGRPRRDDHPRRARISRWIPACR